MSDTYNYGKFKELKIRIRDGTKNYPKYGFHMGSVANTLNLEPLKNKFKNEYIPCKKAIVTVNKKIYSVLHLYNTFKMINMKEIRIPFPMQL